MANTWNQSGTTWGTGRWGTTEALTSGWGVDAWNTGGSWGQATDEVVQVTGLSATLSIGDVISGANQGWGRAAWGEEPYGESDNPVVTLTGQSATLSVGDVTVDAQIAVGWGQDGWGVENYGQSGLTVELTAPDAITSDLGPNGWSNGTFGENSWGMFTLNPADVVGLTGQSATASVGSPTPIIDFTGVLTGQSATLSVGTIAPTEMSVGLGGQAITSAVGSIAPADVVGITGVSATSSIGSVVVDNIELIDLTGLSSTVSVGSVTVDDMAVGLSGISATLSVGSITAADMTVGLTGQEITTSVAGFGVSTGFGIQAYQDVDTGTNITYSDVA